MSIRTSTHDEDLPETVEERILKLEEIEDDLRLVASTDCAYAKHARQFLRALKEVRDT